VDIFNHHTIFEKPLFTLHNEGLSQNTNKTLVKLKSLNRILWQKFGDESLNPEPVVV